MSPERRALDFLREYGAGSFAHPGGTLLAHLKRTHRLLISWQASRELVLAGLCHAVYGTDGFPHVLIEPDNREPIIRLIGPEAENVVYTYASCDRAFTLPQLGRCECVELRDRFTDQTYVLDETALRNFVELTVANEVDIVRHFSTATQQTRDTLADLFARCRPFASRFANSAADTALTSGVGIIGESVEEHRDAFSAGDTPDGLAEQTGD